MKPRFAGDPLVGKWRAAFQFRPRGLWVGVWWTVTDWWLEIRICILPGLPLQLFWEWTPEPLVERLRVSRRDAP